MEKPTAGVEEHSKQKSSKEDCPESPKEIRKIKYFRKVNLIQGKDSIKSLLKKNYCLNALSLYTSVEKPNFIKRLLQSQRFLKKLCFLSPKVSIKRRTNPKYLKRLEQTINTQQTQRELLAFVPRFFALRELCLNLDLGSEKTPGEVALIIDSFGKYLNGLRRLTLSFGLFCDKKREATIQSFVQQIGNNFKNLQHLNLKFSWKNLTSEEAQILVKHLNENFQFLQSLSLCFNNCYKLSYSGLQNLASQFGTSLSSLQALRIQLSTHSEAPAKEVHDLIQRIGVNLPKLRHLDLDFFECFQFTNEIVEYLTSQIGNHLKRLTHLRLAFARYKGYSIEVAENVAKNVLTQLTNLESLDLDFRKTSSILTDQGIKVLAEKISHLQGLKRLHFNFKDCFNVTYAGIKNLAIEIHTHLKMLEEFSIVTSCFSTFGHAETITDLATILKY